MPSSVYLDHGMRVVECADLTHDRMTFERDAESSLRLSNPDDSIQFLKSLCERQARKELIGRQALSADHARSMHAVHASELLRWCEVMGYFHPRVLSVRLNTHEI
jgi:hypothetical protein